MKKWFIAAAVAGVIAVATVAFIGVNSTSVSAAEGGVATTDDGQADRWHDGLLNRLVEEGLITREQAEGIDENLPDGALPFQGRGFRGLSEDFDPEMMLEHMMERFEDFDPQDLPEGFELPEGFDLDELLDQFKQQVEDLDPQDMPEGFAFPEGFDPREMFREFRERFKEFDPRNPPEGFVHPRGFSEEGFQGAHGFGLLGDALKDVFNDMDPDEIRDAIENGTLADLIDADAILAGASADLDQAVADGILSEEQANRILEGLTDTLQSIEDGEFRFGRTGPGGSRDFGRFGPFGGQESEPRAEGTSVEA